MGLKWENKFSFHQISSLGLKHKNLSGLKTLADFVFYFSLLEGPHLGLKVELASLVNHQLFINQEQEINFYFDLDFRKELKSILPLSTVMD